jgi:DNA polymerase elongation subunit (family B)
MHSAWPWMLESRAFPPGRFCNPILAAFVTAGSRLMLAMAESEVALAGGTFAFCDTDSLAIVSGEDCPIEIPCISKSDVDQIIKKFDLLNPYDAQLVPHLLKIEHEKIDNLRCWAISAKRYVLFTKSNNRHFKIIKASESGLGGIIGRTERENTGKLASRIWLQILCTEL